MENSRGGSAFGRGAESSVTDKSGFTKTGRVQDGEAASVDVSPCLEKPQLSQGRRRLRLSHTN